MTRRAGPQRDRNQQAMGETTARAYRDVLAIPGARALIGASAASQIGNWLYNAALLRRPSARRSPGNPRAISGSHEFARFPCGRLPRAANIAPASTPDSLMLPASGLNKLFALACALGVAVHCYRGYRLTT